MPPALRKQRALFWYSFGAQKSIVLPLDAHHLAGDLLNGVRTAHLHGVGQLTGQLVDVALDAFLAAAVDSRDEGAADEDAVGTQSQRLEDIDAGADAAVHEDLDAGALEGGSDLRQDLGGGGALVEDAAAVVGHHDGSGTGLLGLQRAPDGHDALDDEGPLGQLNDLGQLGHALAACRRSHVLEEGQAGGVHVHGHGKAAAGLGLRHLLLNGVDVPRLDGGHAAAVGIADGLGGHGHDVGVGAVAGEGGDAALGAGPHQHVVVGHVGVGIGVMVAESILFKVIFSPPAIATTTCVAACW